MSTYYFEAPPGAKKVVLFVSGEGPIEVIVVTKDKDQVDGEMEVHQAVLELKNYLVTASSRTTMEVIKNSQYFRLVHQLWGVEGGNISLSRSFNEFGKRNFTIGDIRAIVINTGIEGLIFDNMGDRTLEILTILFGDLQDPDPLTVLLYMDEFYEWARAVRALYTRQKTKAMTTLAQYKILEEVAPQQTLKLLNDTMNRLQQTGLTIYHLLKRAEQEGGYDWLTEYRGIGETKAKLIEAIFSEE